MRRRAAACSAGPRTPVTPGMRRSSCSVRFRPAVSLATCGPSIRISVGEMMPAENPSAAASAARRTSESPATPFVRENPSRAWRTSTATYPSPTMQRSASGSATSRLRAMRARIAPRRDASSSVGAGSGSTCR